MSFKNDTDDIIMVKRTANTKIIAPIVASIVAVAGAAVTTMTGGIAGTFAVAGTTITYAAIGAAAGTSGAFIAGLTANTIIDVFEDELVSGYKRDGFIEVAPHTEYKWGSQSLSLNQRLWCIRFTRVGIDQMSLRTANSSVWTGKTKNSNIRYKASNGNYFGWKDQDTYRVEVTTPRGAEGFVDIRDPTAGGTEGASCHTAALQGIIPFWNREVSAVQ